MKRNKHLDSIIDQATKASFKDGKLLEPEVTKLVSAFKKQTKTDAIYLVSGYLKGIKREIAKSTLLVESTIPLSKSDISEIKKSLKHLTINNELLTINNELLGGIKAKIGDTVYDYSITAKLNQLKEVISS